MGSLVGVTESSMPCARRELAVSRNASRDLRQEKVYIYIYTPIHPLYIPYIYPYLAGALEGAKGVQWAQRVWDECAAEPPV